MTCTEHCKGCHHPIVGYPALSRFGHGDICSDCGVREAFLGDFITMRRVHEATHDEIAA
jgi:hypothetical protein